HLCLTPSRRPPISTLLPYTTLFRSRRIQARRRQTRWSVRKPRYRTRPKIRSRRSQQKPNQNGRRAAKLLTRQTSIKPSRPPKRRSEEHTSELQSRSDLVCRLLLEKK